MTYLLISKDIIVHENSLYLFIFKFFDTFNCNKLASRKNTVINKTYNLKIKSKTGITKILEVKYFKIPPQIL